jgi:hypothetical protein
MRVGLDIVDSMHLHRLLLFALFVGGRDPERHTERWNAKEFKLDFRLLA